MQHEIVRTSGIAAGAGAGRECLRHDTCIGAEHSVQTTKIIELERAGKFSKALTLAQKTLADAEKAHGPVHRDFAAALNNLGHAYANLGQDSEAEPLYRRALAIFEKAGGLDSADIAPTLNNLAALYQRQDRLADAEPLFRRALLISERSLGPSHPDTGRSLNNLATPYEKLGRHGDSEPLFKRALVIYEKAAGPEHPAVATLLNNLGQVAKVTGRYTEPSRCTGARCRSASARPALIIRRRRRPRQQFRQSAAPGRPRDSPIGEGRHPFVRCNMMVRPS